MTKFWGEEKNGSKKAIYQIFELKEKRSRAEPKILQLELWLEPARLGLITTACSLWYEKFFVNVVKEWSE